MVAHLVLLGAVFPLASGGQWFWLGTSGVVGLGIGDSGLFAAYVTIGPRRSLLLMALAPIFASLGAYFILGETLPAVAVLGIALTLGGVVLVILEGEEHSGEAPVSGKLKKYGVLCGLVAAIGQGLGLVLAKKGIDLNPAVTLNPLSATLMRMVLGACSLWFVMLAAGKLPQLRNAFNSREGMRQTVAAAFLGPFLGVTLSMVAVTYAETGIAQTLLSLMPVMIIPVVWILYKQKTSSRNTGSSNCGNRGLNPFPSLERFQQSSFVRFCFVFGLLVCRLLVYSGWSERSLLGRQLVSEPIKEFSVRGRRECLPVTRPIRGRPARLERISTYRERWVCRRRSRILRWQWHLQETFVREPKKLSATSRLLFQSLSDQVDY